MLRTIAVCLALAAWPVCPVASAANAPDEAAGAAEGADSQVARTGLVGGQSIVGTILEERLTVETSYGELTVPLDEVIRIRFGLRLEEDRVAALAQLVADLEKAGAESDEGKEISEKIRAVGVVAVPSLRRLRGKTRDEKTQKRLGEILDTLQSEENGYFAEDDEVMSERFTIRGRIVVDSFRIRSLLGTLEIPSEDIRRISFRETEVKKTYKVGAQYLENRTALVTKIRVRKGQKISLAPSGTMSYDGQVFGPAGLRYYSWNGRQMGALQWRVSGSSTWQLLTTAFDGPAPASGALEFCIHHTGGALSGEFTIKFKTSAR